MAIAADVGLGYRIFLVRRYLQMDVILPYVAWITLLAYFADLALVRIGIVEIDQLKSMRRYIYFAIAVLAAAITPGDVITATILLMIPLVLLYELGIWLARVQRPHAPT